MRNKPSVILGIEFLCLFCVLPLTIVTLRVYGVKTPVLGALWLMVGFCCWLDNRSFLGDAKLTWRESKLHHPFAKHMWLRFLTLGTGLAIAVAFISPPTFLSFPTERPIVWAIVMLVYPILSVWPQELVFRPFFFSRYSSLFSSPRTLAGANILTFTLMHVIFRNPLALVLTFAGGILFTHTYMKSRSLYLAWLEHTLYGCLIISLGLGRYLFLGAR